MDYLLSLINGAVGDEELARLLFVGAIGLSAVLTAATLIVLVNGLRDPMQRRLVQLKRGQAGLAPGLRPPSPLQLMLERVGQRFDTGEDAKTSATRTLLTHAGYRSPSALQVYWAVRLLLPLLLVGLAFLALPLIPKLSLEKSILLLSLAGGIGWLVPAIYIDKRKEARMKTLRAAFPDALDLMVVCVESGLALPQAIERVADEMAVSQAELAEELALVNAEIRAGIPSTEALKHLADRTGLDDVQGLVSLLAQSIRFGTSVADSLRTFAVGMREQRSQRAEEQAEKTAVKLLFPLVFFIFPVMLIVMVGPAGITLYRIMHK
jgi:tight adherence protein C